MDDILSKYINNPKNKELEVRFKNVDKVTVLSALDAIIKNGMQYVFTAFVDMLDYGPDTKYGIRVFYTNGVVTDRQPFKKKSIAHVKDKDHNIVLSEETEDNSISSGQLKPKKVILKYRVSTTIVGYEEWRIDIDVIHELDHVAQAVKKAMTNFVKITNIDELMSSLSTERYTYRIEAEHIGHATQLSFDDIMDATTLLSMLSEKDTKSSLLFGKKIKRIAEILYPDNETLRIKKAHSPCLKYVVPGVRALTYQEYQKMFPPVDFMISSKIDGYRALILMIDSEAHMIYKRNSVKTLSMKSKGPSTGITLLEGEYIESSNLFVLFDVLHFGRVSLIDKPLEARLEYMDEAVKLIMDHVKDIDIEAITYVGLSNESEYKKIMTSMMDTSSKLPTDGLILTRKGLPYTKSEIYKWKPSHHQTIDFYCKECPESWYNDTTYIKRKGKKLYFLYNGIHKQLMRNIGLIPHDRYNILFPDTMDYAKIPIQFSTPITPLSYLYYHDDDDDSLNNMVVELSIGPEYGSDNMIDWKFVKARDDKMCTNGQDYGNAYDTALKTLLNHIDPFPIEYLYMPSIATHKAITPVQKYLSYIKDVAISEYSKHAKHIMDIGMTDGSNLLNYMRKNATSLTVIDVDKANIVRIVERWIDLSNNSLPPTNLKAVVVDINDDVSDNISKMLPIIGSIRYDTVFAFYTVQNFTQTVESIRNFALFCQRLTEKKAKICIIVLSGRKVHEMGNWKAIEHGQVKYAIERKYMDDQLLNANQQVDITSPANGSMTQYLVNIDHLTEVFKEQSMSLVAHKSALDYMNGFQVHDSNKYERLTDNDKKYIGLYDVIVYERK